MPQHLHRHSHHHPIIIIISHHHRHSQQGLRETLKRSRTMGLKVGQIMGKQTERTTPAMAQEAVAAMTTTHTEVEADRGGGNPSTVETVMERTRTKGRCPKSPSS
jgi:hypothetical protein